MNLLTKAIFALTLFVIIAFTGCNKEAKTKEQKDNSAYIEKIKKHRAKYDNWMKTSPESPLIIKVKSNFTR